MIAFAIVVGIAFTATPAAFAQDGLSHDGLDAVDENEIIVTARFREQAAQDVGQSISVLSGDDLENRGISDIADIVRSTPGLGLIDRGPGRNLPTIRGAAPSEQPSDILQQPTLIAQFFDEIATTVPTQNQPDLPLYDLSRIEILKGPQPTYFGEGSVGGSIRYFAREPSLTEAELRTRAEASATEGSRSLNYVVDASLGVPIVSEALGVRITAFRRHDAGFIDDSTTGQKDINPSDFTGGTAILLAKPTDALTMRLSAMYQKARIEGDRIVSKPIEKLQQGGPNELPFPGAPLAHDDLLLLSARISYDLEPVTLESITGYYRRKFDQTFIDRSQTYLVIPGLFGLPASPVRAVNNQHDENFTQEFRVVTQFGGPINFVGGLYYADTRSMTAQEQRSDAFIAPTGDDFYFGAVSDIRGKQFSQFGEIQLSLIGHRLRLAAGARHFAEHLVTPIEGSIKLPIAGGRIMLFSLPGLLGGPGAAFRNEIDKTLLHGQAEFEVAPDMLVYASVSEGARIGLFNSPANIAVGGLSQAEFGTYGPDSVVAYEAGFKSRLLDRRLRLNASVFQMNWSDLQVPFSIGAGAVGVVLNGPDARTRGFELEADFPATENVTLLSSVAYTDARFTQTARLGQGCAGCGFLVTPHTRIPNVPDWNVSLGIETRWRRVVSFGDVFARAYYQYSGSTVATIETQDAIDSYDIVNLRLGVENERWSVTLFADNLFNEISTIFVGSVSTGGTSLGENYVNRPRTIGLTFRGNF